MNNNLEEYRIQDSANKALSDSLSSIEQQTQARLRNSRMQALALAEKQSIWQIILKPFPIASALAFSFALIFVLPQWQSNSTSENRQLFAQQEVFDDLLLLSEVDDDTLELIEDLEFALWLSEEMDTPSEGANIENQARNNATQDALNITLSNFEATSAFGYAYA